MRAPSIHVSLGYVDVSTERISCSRKLPKGLNSNAIKFRNDLQYAS